MAEVTTIEIKESRALLRLEAGALIYDTGEGWKFHGNKFVPARVVRRLPLEYLYTTNRGWRAYRLDPLHAS